MSFGEKFCGCDGEDAGAGADVKKTASREMLLNCLEAETSRLVSAGAERHAGFDANNQTVVSVSELSPRRRDNETTDFNRLPVLLPLFEPIALCNLANVHVAH